MVKGIAMTIVIAMVVIVIVTHFKIDENIANVSHQRVFQNIINLSVGFAVRM